MKIKERYQQLRREDVEKISPDPETGLTAQQVQTRLDRGWANVAHDGPGRSEQEIILGNLFTFFNLIFVILAVLLLISGSSIVSYSLSSSMDAISSLTFSPSRMIAAASAMRLF